MIAAACVAYYGAFTNTYREELVNTWNNACREDVSISDFMMILLYIFLILNIMCTTVVKKVLNILA